MNKKTQVLKKIAHQLNEENITWALGASMLLYFKGITDEFHDIDLMILNKDAERVRRILCEMGEQQPANPDITYATKTFMEFQINGIDIDVMAGFAIVNDGKVYDCSLRKEQIAEYISLDGEKIPLHSLVLWEKYYRLMGREEKADRIQKYIYNSNKSITPPLPKGRSL